MAKSLRDLLRAEIIGTSMNVDDLTNFFLSLHEDYRQMSKQIERVRHLVPNVIKGIEGSGESTEDIIRAANVIQFPSTKSI
jgi:hypothetical protein